MTCLIHSHFLIFIVLSLPSTNCAQKSSLTTSTHFLFSFNSFDIIIFDPVYTWIRYRRYAADWHATKMLLFFIGLKYTASKSILIKTHRIVELLCKILNSVVLYNTPFGFTFPKAIMCYVIYYSTDAGTNAFKLPLPMW